MAEKLKFQTRGTKFDLPKTSLKMGGALILFLVSGKIRVTSSPNTSLFIGTEVMKDASDFNYQLDLPETRKSLLCDSSVLSKSAH